MDQQHSTVPELFLSLNKDFISSKNDLMDAINIITKNTKESIRNSQTKMESCIDAITSDYVTFEIPPESSVDPCEPINQKTVNEYNQYLYDLYIRANIGYNKIFEAYEEEKLTVTKMITDLKRKIELFYTQIQSSLEDVVQNSTRDDLLMQLKNHEKIHVKKCNKFKSVVDKIFHKINKKCLQDTHDFDRNINKLIWVITQAHIDILEKYKVIKLTVCRYNDHL